MADAEAPAEPIIIHGTRKGITITHGSSVTTITPPKGTPFHHVVVNTDGKKTAMFTNPKQQKKWEIRIEPARPVSNKRTKRR